MYAMREWISAAGALALMEAARLDYHGYEPRTKWRYKAKRSKTASQIKRAKAQKAQRHARRKNRK